MSWFPIIEQDTSNVIWLKTDSNELLKNFDSIIIHEI